MFRIASQRVAPTSLGKLLGLQEGGGADSLWLWTVITAKFTFEFFKKQILD